MIKIFSDSIDFSVIKSVNFRMKINQMRIKDWKGCVFMLTKNDVLIGLKNIGVRLGMELEVHSSLSSFGYVEGGAQTIISALKNVVVQKAVFLCRHCV